MNHRKQRGEPESEILGKKWWIYHFLSSSIPQPELSIPEESSEAEAGSRRPPYLVLLAREATKGTPNTLRNYGNNMVSFFFSFCFLFSVPWCPGPQAMPQCDDRHWNHNSARPKTLRKGKLALCSVKLWFQEDWVNPIVFFLFISLLLNSRHCTVVDVHSRVG